MPTKTTRTALLLGLLLGTGALAQGASRRVAVLPFQALSGEVPARSGPRVAARLASELKTQKQVLAEPPAPPSNEALARARAAMKEAQALREAHDFAKADATLAQALEAYAAGATALEQGELADAYALRAAVRYATGRDDEAEQQLAQALMLSPGRALPLAATSPLFARTVERVRAELGKRPRGAVRISSVPPSVAVTLDGQSVGVAPVRVMGVPSGVHLWRAVPPSGEPVAGLVEVAGGKEAEATVLPPGEGPGAALALALANNRLEASALEAAGTLGQAAKADLVVFGAVSRAGAGLALDTFVLAPGTHKLRRLPRVSLDAELLDAGAPLQQLATLLATRGAEAGEAVTLPTAVATPAPLPPAQTQSVYPVQAESSPAAEPEKPAAPPKDRRPLTPRKPLSRP